MPLTSRRSLRPVLLTLAVAGLALAGTAGAYFMRTRRDVTTSSEKAWRAYHEAAENDLKMYEREAISGYAAALQEDPHFVMATLRLAEKMRGRDPDRAKSLLASAARHRDEITEREKLLLRIYEERWGRRDMAVLGKLFDEYVERFPGDPEGYRFRANHLSMVNRNSDAIAEYERLLAINPNYATAYNTLGYYWAERGDFAKAEDFLKRYRYLAPDQANPFDSLGELYARIGRYDEAEENLRKALAIKEDFFASYGHLGSVEVGRGHPEKAAVWFRKAADAAAGPWNRAEFRYLVVVTLCDAGKIEEARKEFDDMTAEARSFPAGSEAKSMALQALFRRTVFLARAGDAAEADAALEAVLKATPPEGDAEKAKGYARDLAFLRGVVAARARRFAEGAEILGKALADDGPSGFGGTEYYSRKDTARILLADCLFRLGRREEAEKALQPVLARNPRYQPALDQLARIKG
ncbi:MAG: tetratricopeptide repeat protein [Thermoanaerobaculia bacterium]|nr:tetratricopeptide repeat protein [Thermoanaerobaculia bacterium]